MNAIMQFLLVGAGMRFLTYGACVFALGQSLDAMKGILPDFNFDGILAGLPDAVYYGIGFVNGVGCLQIIIPAAAIRFALDSKRIFG